MNDLDRVGIGLTVCLAAIMAMMLRMYTVLMPEGENDMVPLLVLVFFMIGIAVVLYKGENGGKRS